jgi:aspartyl-tRNA(Asn)/glutamyl-tRNA(Gln) amidotransferase subunit A
MAEIPEEVFFASATELNRRLRAKEFSAVELTRAFCDRLERLGPRYNALALSVRDIAVRKAKDVDDEIKRERFRGPLQGVPYGAKDLLSVKGQITTWGAKPFAAQVFDFDATAITRLARTGAVLTGKLAMVELAGGGGYRYPAASLFGPGLNPWDRTRWSGGSSSGSGSAVAAGLVTYALGSETSGSILTPSAFCGVTGLRPTYGLVSRHGAMPLSWTMDKIGPMCHTAEDCGYVLQAIAGKDENDPASAGKSFYFAPQYAREIKTIRVGFVPSDFDAAAEPETRAALSEALTAVKALGVELKEVKLADLPYGPVTSTVISAEGASVFEELIESGAVDQLADEKQIAGLKAGLEIPARDYLRAMRIRRLIQNEFRRVFMDCDVLLAPARSGVAPKIDQPLDGRSSPPGPGAQPPPAGMRALIPAANLAGLPALCLPCGLPNNLPVAIQLVGRPFSENLLLSVGMRFQQATDWHRRHPKV